ncbi:MAG: 50S ribosomal protein L25 [Planctomycetota bacterium]|nr:50S ribosomal protein L25 [Planctomycetota bacterium]
MPRTLKAEIRGEKELGSRPARRLRRVGRLPAVIYGAGEGARSISVDTDEFMDALHGGERVVNVELAGKTTQALIKDIRYDPLGLEVLHVDFHELAAGQTVKVEVAVVLRGTPKGTAEGGVLNHVLHEVRVECLPADIPDNIKVDVSEMKLGDIIHVKDLPLPKGVRIVDMDPDAAVAICEAPRVEKEPEPVEAGAPVEPEVITARKEEPESGGEGEKKEGETARKTP